MRPRKTQKHTPARPVQIRSSVNRLFTYSAAPVFSPFSALGAATKAAFLFLIYAVSFIERRKFVLNNVAGAKGNLHRKASWRIVKFWCSGWCKHTQKFSKKVRGQLTLLPLRKVGAMPPPHPLFLRLWFLRPCDKLPWPLRPPYRARVKTVRSPPSADNDGRGGGLNSGCN